MTRRDNEIHGAIVISLALLACGILLWARWPETATAARVLFWGGSSALVLLLALFPNQLRQLNRFVPSLFLSPWTWLGLSMLIAALPLFDAEGLYGAKRHLESTLMIRSGLWALICHLVFLAMLAEKEQLPLAHLILVLSGTCGLALLFIAQPDMFALLGLIFVCAAVGLSTRNCLRLWLPLTGIAGFLVLVMIILTSPYRLKRVLAAFDHESDPYGRGFEPRVLKQALDQAGWFGHHDIANSAMNFLPKNLEWYTFNYLGLWMGKVAIFALLLMLFLLALMLILQLYHATRLHRSILAGAVALFVLNLCWQIPGAFIPILPNAHFGLPFLNPGQFSLATSLLLLFAAITTSERRSTA